jgi:small-conductance mechanosensitive channel/CRP-like cAMP-binding protein
MEWLEQFGKLLEWGITVGDRKITVVEFTLFAVLTTLVFLAASVVRRLLLSRVLARTGMSAALQKVISRFAGYFVIFVGLFAALQIIGIQLGSLAFLAGALGLGLGFGLQNVISNFVSGLIILIERPIQVGDRIDVGGIEGDVVEIKARSTTIVTNDNISIIVPNSEFISSRVINWSHGDPKVRFRVPVGVAYGSDPKLVEKALLEVADEVIDVMRNPPPAVRFLSFGDSSLNFELRVWTDTLVHQKNKLVSQINFGIFEKFRKYGIEIPFPQRDVHIKRMASPPAAPKSPPQTAADLLRRSPLFAALSDGDIEQLVARGEHRRFVAGQKIIQQGATGDSLFVILSGVVSSEYQKPDGAAIPLGTLGHGDFVGEGSMLTGEPRRATIIAESPVEAFELCKECLAPILDKSPQIAEQLSQVLAERTRQYKQRIEATSPGASVLSAHSDDATGILRRIRSFFRLG